MNILEAIKQDIEDWINKVRNGEGDLLDWFLFLGIVAMLTYLWQTVIKRVVD